MANRHDELQHMLRDLKLATMVTACSPTALKAAKEGLSHEAFLYELVRLECEERRERRAQRYLQQSQLPREKTLHSFRLERLSLPLRVQVERLKSGMFVEEAHNVLLVGPPGTGKSHLAAALGQELIKQGYPTLWCTTVALVQRLLAAKQALRLPQEMARLDRFRCLILDDIGYVQHDRDEMEVLFTLLAERYERRSLMITTNLVFSAWDRIFKDPMTTLAAVDRVVHHSVILDMTGVESFRVQEAREGRLQGTEAATDALQTSEK